MALLPFSRWRPRHLLVAWSAWWAGLAAATLGPSVVAIREVTRLPKGEGRVELAYDDGLFTLMTSASEVVTHTASASLLEIALWVAGPPLLLWALWLATRTRREGAALEAGPVSAPALGAADPLRDAAARDVEARTRREREGASRARAEDDRAR